MTDRGAGCGISRLSGSERGRVSTVVMGEILWRRRETRRQTEKTNFTLSRWKCLSYSKRNRRLRKEHPVWILLLRANMFSGMLRHTFQISWMRTCPAGFPIMTIV